jgi:hypothetical protein
VIDESTHDVSSRRIEWLILGASALIALAFAIFTQHVWEDFYITYRAGKNMALGYGLLFEPGQRVHSYTSPVGAVLPGLISYAIGNRSDLVVIWVFRIIGIALLGATGVVVARTQRRLNVDHAVIAFTLVMLGLETKIIDFSINGQEGAFMVFFVCAAWAAAATNASPLMLGAIFAGLQWSRPDGFMYGGAVWLGVWLFATEGGFKGRWHRLRVLAPAALVVAVLYGPWVLWCWQYYGTPMPHTIIAKMAYSPDHHALGLLKSLFTFPFDVLTGGTSTRLAFAPVYADLGRGGWPPAILIGARVLGTVAALYWMLPRVSGHARALSFAFALCHYHLTHIIHPSPWYLPPASAVGVLTLGFVAQDAARLARHLVATHQTRAAQALQWTARLSAVAVTLFIAGVLALSAIQLRIQQREIEDETRTRLGRWLWRAAEGRKETVFLEPLGYIGFFSHLKMLDFPGLASPEVVAARRELQTNDWNRLIRRLWPDWLVLRPREEADIRREDPTLLEREYRTVRIFDATERLEKYRWIPGSGYLRYDRRFTVFRRQRTQTADIAAR